MNWSNITKNLGLSLKTQGERAVGSITDAWDAFKNLDSLSLPEINGMSLFNSISQITSSFSDAGTNDNVQTNLLHGLEEIWTNNNTGLNQKNIDVYVKLKPGSTDDNMMIEQTMELDSRADDYKFPSSEDHWQYYNSKNSDHVTKFQETRDNDVYEEIVDTHDADRLNFQTPDWSYADFINERAIFQKSLQNPLGEQGWFYFKIFFNFDTQYGLFGGLLNNRNPLMATNSAYKYLHTCESLGTYYKTNDRQVALMKFAKILSYISTYAPWFFKGIKNLNQANIPQIDDFTKEKSIEIECSTDAIDMRLNTLMDLYKFACYDEIDQKEIVPDNLRKFDMTVMVFQSPIKYFHTAFTSQYGHKYDYKGTSVDNNSGFSDTMSFKMFTFVNCEIDRESLGNMIPGTMSNEKPFTMGGGSIKILYDRVYTHTMNEFMHIMFGNDGLYYDGSASTEKIQGVDAGMYRLQTALQKQRIKDIANSYDAYNGNSPSHKNDSTSYKAIVDASEALCINNMRALGFNALGNFSDNNKDLQFDLSKDNVTANDYYNLKIKMLKNDTTILNDALNNVSAGASNMIKELVSSYNTMKASMNATWTEGDKNLTTDSMGHIISNTQKETAGNLYWANKIYAMKDGYVSPETLVQRYELQKYDYLSFTKSGYADKIINLTNKGKIVWDGPGTGYWQRKIKSLTDGIVSPETLEQRYENQSYDYSQHGGQEQNGKTMTTDFFGNLTPSEGTEYWKRKITAMTDGVVSPETLEQRYDKQRYNYSGFSAKGQADKAMTTDSSGHIINSIGSNYWLEKIKQLKEGVIKSNTPEINIKNERSNSGLSDESINNIKSRMETLKTGTIPHSEPSYTDEDIKLKNIEFKNGTIPSNKPEVKVDSNEPNGGLNDPYGGDYYENKLINLYDGTIEKNPPEINVNLAPSGDGLNDPYSGEYFNAKIDEMNDGIVDPDNIITSTQTPPGN